jgi:hypothetical protein
MLEGGAVVGRRGSDVMVEGRPESGRAAEPTQPGDPLDGHVGGLEELAGPVDAGQGQPGQGGRAGLLPEAPRERAARHVRPLGELVQGVAAFEGVEHPGPDRGEVAAAGGGPEALDELRLAAGPARRGDQYPRADVDGCGAVVFPDDVQAQVDSGGHPGRGEDVTVIDVEPIGPDVDRGIHPLQARAFLPVGGGRAAVEQSGGGEGERPGADRHQPRPARVSEPERLKHRRGDQRIGDKIAGDDDRRGVRNRLKPAVRRNGEAAAPDGLVRRVAADRYPVVRVGSERLHRDTQVERKHSWECQHRNAALIHDRHGPILAVRSSRATVRNGPGAPSVGP